MYYGNIKKNDIANGKGVRVTLFVSGCTNHCKNCFQPETWNFDYGKPYTKKTEDENHKLVWECPNCGNRDQEKMNVARRTCGYIGTQFWNQGRTQEIKERVLHL